MKKEKIIILNKNSIINNLKQLNDLNLQLREQDTVLYWEIDKNIGNILNLLNNDHYDQNKIKKSLDNILDTVNEIDLFDVVLASKIHTIVHLIMQEVK